MCPVSMYTGGSVVPEQVLNRKGVGLLQWTLGEAARGGAVFQGVQSSG